MSLLSLYEPVTTIVDSCVIMDVSNPNNLNYELLLKIIARRRRVGPLYAPDIVFAEVAAGCKTLSDCERIFSTLEVKITHLPKQALFRAAHEFVKFRKKNKSVKSKHKSEKRIISDFYLGSLALEEQIPLLTTDKRNWNAIFKGIELVDIKL